MRQDIFGMLKSAVERGEDVQKVANSLINAGYPAAEVQNAMSYLGGGAMGALSVPSPPVQQQMPYVPKQVPQQPQAPMIAQKPIASQQMPMQQTPQTRTAFPVPKNMQVQPLPKTYVKKAFPVKLFFLILALIILLGGLAATIVFKDKIISLF